MKQGTTGSSQRNMADRFSKRTKARASSSKKAKPALQRTLQKTKPKLPGIPPRWPHQNATLEKARQVPTLLDLSCPGTGKTRSHLEAFAERRRAGGRAALVVAPKSLLRPAWYDDAMKYCPDMFCSIAYAENRQAAFDVDADIYVTNSDAVKWLAEQRSSFFKKFDTLIIDELIAFKHRTSQRSKAIASFFQKFDYRVGLNGTFTAGHILDVWHQTYLIDGGERLGNDFYRFRGAVCTPVQVGPKKEHVEWQEKEGASEAVAGLLADITVRHQFDEVMDIPPNYTRTVEYYPSDKLMKKYQQMETQAILELENADVEAVNAAVLRNKLLQIASGAVYGNHEGEGQYHLLDTSRYQLIVDLALEVQHAVIFFNWSHQKEEIAKEAKKQKVPFEVIDGKVPVKKRSNIVQRYQNGEYRFLLLHPQTGAHGLTLTKGTRTIWASPIYQPDFLKQGLHRIWRGGQTQKTETILVEAAGTVESIVYAKLSDKNAKMVNLMDMLKMVSR